MRASRRVLSSDAEWRVQRGLAVQPFLAAALAFAFFPALEYWTPGRTTGALGAAIGVSVYIGISAVFLTALAAYPLLCWLLPRVRLGARHAVAAGVAVGNIPNAIAIFLAIGTTVRRTGTLPAADVLLMEAGRGILFGSVIGACCAFVFWRISGSAIRDAQVRADGGLATDARH